MRAYARGQADKGEKFSPRDKEHALNRLPSDVAFEVSQKFRESSRGAAEGGGQARGKELAEDRRMQREYVLQFKFTETETRGGD